MYLYPFRRSVAVRSAHLADISSGNSWNSFNELASVTALRMLNDFNVVRGVVLHIPIHHFTYKVRSISLLTRDIPGGVEIYFSRTDTVKITVIILFNTACLRRAMGLVKDILCQMRRQKRCY